ncbi:PAR1 protein [Cinnamomum micranthum f. kanehirae]|uniref:PAR1 protein n=1 Tax=Cinnamomum micranthum f. kanehirae TaxID=337451 RepID=A0A443N0Z9_9MAGN|nr:PAR1 protein [Cinnamomum micranthum f. kanehirae]
MASSFFGFKTITCVALALVLCVQKVLGGITCEKLDKSTCAFAVSSMSTRCVLEKRVRRGGMEEYTCRSSEIEAEKLKDWIETDQCIESCGLDRNTLGISSDALLDSQFVKKLCSSQCYQGCPNIVDLYFNLAAGEGVFLPKLCEAQGGNSRREMAEIKSSGIVAPAPGSVSPLNHLGLAPAMAPAMAPF